MAERERIAELGVEAVRVGLAGMVLVETYPHKNASRVKIERSLFVARVREGRVVRIEVVALKP